MTALSADFSKMCEANRDGSFATQAERRIALNNIATILHRAGYKVKGARGLKPKHTDIVLGHISKLAPATQKNIMAHYRWALGKAGKCGMVPKSNADLGIPDRKDSSEDKAIVLDMDALERVTCPYAKMSLRLMAAFGLRREEAIKFKPALADQGDCIHLDGSWTKGGKAREVPVLSERQRALLEEAKVLAGRGSLIPPEMNYKKQRERLEYQSRQKAGMAGKHGLRHKYAQVRYKALTGWACPKAGGTSKLTPAQRLIDQQVRLQISQELGHERIEITQTYLG